MIFRFMVWLFLPVQWMVTAGNLFFVLFKGPILLVLALNHHNKTCK